MSASGIAVLIAFVATACLTGIVREIALRRGMLDVPNTRSSHTVPTPRGGGIAIVAVACGLALVATATRFLPPMPILAIIASGVLVAAIGFIDDRRGLSASARALVHVVAAAPSVIIVFNGDTLRTQSWDLPFALAYVVIAVISIVWYLNLFNFMDGIDGLAAAQSAFVCFGGAMLLSRSIGDHPAVWSLAAIGAASLGFLIWNFPLARIFLGDVGSGFLGVVLALSMLWTVTEEWLSVWTWIILTALFLVDASMTLVVRISAGQRWYEAHRSHAYQHLARRWRSHVRVTSLFVSFNALILFPLAVVSVDYPKLAMPLAICICTFLSVVALYLGAGRHESSSESS